LKGRVLVIAGSDSGGGAGIQADIKAITALDGFAMTAITALTAQNTEGVFGIHDVPADFLSRQIEVVLKDLGADCIKLGMLHRADIIEAVCDGLDRFASNVPVVVDPVMVAKGGARLLEPSAQDALMRHIIPRAHVLTPNLPEAEALTGISAPQAARAQELAEALLTLGCHAALVKGGHRDDEEVMDLLLETGKAPVRFISKRIETRHTHGTGCTLASAIATGIAQGLPLEQAVGRARAYVLEAIRTAPGYGAGHGPLNHAHTIKPSEPA
jgi:hydroxymethylpyrimidine/phosphomethylpyrimidine kinase